MKTEQLKPVKKKTSKIFKARLIMRNKYRDIASITLLLAILVFSSCSREKRNHPGYTYFYDMTTSEAYEYYSENPNYSDGKTAQPPVPGTIPRGSIPYQYLRTAEGQKQAGEELKNPLSVTEYDLEIAKEIYEINCAMCHGIEGKGDGHLVTSGKFNTKVTSLVDELVQSKPDGEIFHVISVGSVSGFMGSHRDQVKAEDRWRIASYIKNKLLTKQTIDNP